MPEIASYDRGERQMDEMNARLKELHTEIVADINAFMQTARDDDLDYALTISNLMMLVAHVASTFAVFHFDFTEEMFADVMREHYKIALNSKPSTKDVFH